MTKSVFLVVLLIILFQYATACPSVCTCTGNIVDCTQSGLSDLPTGIPTTTEELFLQENSLSTLTTDMFSTYPSLLILRLDACSISSIEAGAFNGLTALRELSLATNGIETFPDAVFSPFASSLLTLNLAGNSINSLSASSLFGGMTSLTSLDISGNQLSDIPPDVFMDLSAVTTFTLEGNVISSVGSSSLNGLSSITTLNLQNNVISTIEAGAFSSLTSLQVINLNNNNLTTFVSGIFDSLSNLEEINFQSNKIDTLTNAMFSNLPVLESVNLRNNKLTAAHDVFGSIDSLRNLDLSANAFTSLSAYFLLPNGRSLDLSDNQITSISGFPFAALANIMTINLRNNQITTIADGVFGGVEKLETVDLSFNNLTAVPSGSFAGLFGNSKVQELILSDNQIQTIEADAFVSCQNTRTIDLRRNTLSTLNADSFSSLEQIRTIYLSTNSLTRIPGQAFVSLVRLESIFLEQNLLEEIEENAFQNLDVMSQLNLSHNVIHTVADGAFSNIPLLSMLYLNNNRLTAVPKAAVSSLPALQTLYLSNNLITSLSESKSFGDLDNLSLLYLQNNNIGAVVEDCLGGLPALTTVDLSVNNIRAVDAAFTTSNPVSSLASFNLANNTLNSLTENTFTGFTALATLDLSYNNFLSLQEGMFEAARSSLASITITGNNWQCDCDLKWLQANFSSVISGGVCASPELEEGKEFGAGGSNLWIPAECIEETTTTPEPTTTTPEPTTTTPEPTTDALTTTAGTIVIPLTITTVSYSVDVVVGEVVSLECNATGTLPPTVAWTSPSGDVILTRDQYTFDLSTGLLTITGITSNMAGIYHCNADNSAGDRVSIEVEVVVRFPPQIIQFLSVAVLSDASFSLPCEVNAYPHATIQWVTPAETTVNENSTGSIIVTSSGTLHMADRTAQDSGYYTCTASNDLGQANSSGYIFIYDSTSSYPTVTRSVNVGDEVVLACSNLVTSSDSAFAWSLPTGHDILYSDALENGPSRLTYISPSSFLSYFSDGTTQSVEMDNKFSVDTTTGSLTIKNFATSSVVSTDAVTSQAGSYVCRSVRGVYNYVIVDSTVTTTTTEPTRSPSVSSTETDNESNFSVYYIVLGSVLFVVLLVFLFLLAKSHRKKRRSE